MFSSEYFLHFVFANSTDMYYLDSLIQLDLKSYLWYKLKKNRLGYEHIYFVSGSASEITLEVLDQDSYDWYEKKNDHWRKKFIDFFMGAEETFVIKGRTSIRIERDQEKEFCTRILKLMEESTEKEKSAFVFQLSTFSFLFESNKKLLERLIALNDKDNRGSIVVLLASISAGESKDYLLNPNGIFFYKDERNQSLCEDLRAIAAMKQVDLYHQMAKQMKERVIFLNSFSRGQIETLVTSVLMEYPERIGSVQEMEDWIDYLYAWYHSKSFQEQCEWNLEVNQKRYYCELVERLKNQQIWNRLVEQAKCERGQNYDSSLWKILQHRYDIAENEEGEAYIVKEDAFSNRVRSIKFSKEFCKSNGIELAEFERIRQELLTCWNHKSNPGMVTVVTEWLDDIKQAERENNFDSVRRILRALEWGAQNLCVTQEQWKLVDEINTYHQQIIIISNSLYKAKESRSKQRESSSQLLTLMDQSIRVRESILNQCESALLTKVINRDLSQIDMNDVKNLMDENLNLIQNEQKNIDRQINLNQEAREQASISSNQESNVIDEHDKIKTFVEEEKTSKTFTANEEDYKRALKAAGIFK
ncbi:MAG: hypothetical protein ACI4C1_07765 [Lachnospiraceae bacterium]